MTASAALSTNNLNFNATAIPADGRYVWFNSVFTPSGISTTGLTHLFITGSSLGISTDGTISAPNVMITFDPSLNANVSGSASLTYNTGTSTWEETLPVTGLSGTRFLDGVPWLVTSPAGNANVSWVMSFTTDRPGFSLNWQAAAAVYKPFTSDFNALGVKPVDDNQASIYLNSDHSGTPENFKDNVTGGATGGGGSNWTGSYSPTVSVVPSLGDIPEPSCLGLAGLAAVFCLARKRRAKR
jgi:hypothetical protein